ncbi:MAG: hypothetical protein AAGC44_06440 [Planctomycetota bacterium]
MIGPIEVELVRGENVLAFSRKGVQQEVAAKGFAIRDCTLTPVE